MLNKKIKTWTEGVELEASAIEQLNNIASLAIVSPHVAVMPDVHMGIGATVGSVIPTVAAIIPAAVGVDIGCGMIACRTPLTSHDIPKKLAELRYSIERAVPHGGPGPSGGWTNVPEIAARSWSAVEAGYKAIIGKYPKIDRGATAEQLGTLGGGNHFVELCLDEEDRIWIMLHSGSRGVGNRIGQFFIETAKADMGNLLGHLPDKDLAYISEGSPHFDDYVHALSWAQNYALANRTIMMKHVLDQLIRATRPFDIPNGASNIVSCHHNYVNKEAHFGQDVWLTRKGAVSAKLGEFGIIPGSMGAKSFIVRGKGNAESFHSCSHGAGRRMSRGAAKKSISVEDHVLATAGVECRKDASVIDESPGAYKSIDAVMAAQSDLVEIVHTLKQFLVVKG